MDIATLKRREEDLIRIAQVFHISTDNLLGYNRQYTIDAAKLTLEQRHIIQETVEVYKERMSL